MKINMLNFILLFLFCNSYTLHAQDTLVSKHINPHFWYTIDSEPFKLKGALYEVWDSALVVSTSMKIDDYYTRNYETIPLNVNDIVKIKVRNNNNILLGMVAGGIAGIVIGAISGYAEGDDPPCDEFMCHSFSAEYKALEYGFRGLALGAGAGALIGSFKLEISIHGDIVNFEKYRARLEKKSIKNRYLMDRPNE